MRWGAFDLQLISDGDLWLDGGAMFGVVPRVFWEKKMPPDSRNRIRLGLNCLLVTLGGQRILIDTGCGSKLSAKERGIYGLAAEPGLLSALRAQGVEPEEIDWVINTHFHFDHCGGNTWRDQGALRPTYPRARYVVQRQELEDAARPHERNRASYFSENWDILLEEGRLMLLEGEGEIVPGLTCIPTPGHTRGHQSVKLTSEGRTLFYAGDLCPTAAHVPLPWIMAYDLFPLTTLETRRALYARSLQEGWVWCFEHDADRPLGLLETDGSQYAVRAADWID